MPNPTIYGPIVTAGNIRDAYKATLTAWLPSYLAEIERQTGLVLPPIRHYSTGVSPGTPVEQLPAVVIVAPGVDGTFMRHANGSYDAPWGVGVGIVVAHTSRDTALSWAEAYTAALRACIVQHGSLGGFATDTVLNDEETTEVGWNTDHSVAAGSLYFTSTITGVVNASGGPATVPAPNPTAAVTTVTATSTHVTTTPTP